MMDTVVLGKLSGAEAEKRIAAGAPVIQPDGGAEQHGRHLPSISPAAGLDFFVTGQLRIGTVGLKRYHTPRMDRKRDGNWTIPVFSARLSWAGGARTIPALVTGLRRGHTGRGRWIGIGHRWIIRGWFQFWMKAGMARGRFMSPAVD